MKKYIFSLIAIVTLLISSCEMWHTDIVGFLDKYTNTAAIEKEELINGANYPVLNGVTHVPSDGDKVLRFTLRNPQSYTLIPTIENFPNFDNALVDPPMPGEEGGSAAGYSLTQLESNISVIELTFFEDYLRRLDEAGGADLSATIRLVEEETGREFDSYSYELIANTAPIAPVEAVAAKADGIDTYVVVFDMGTQSEREGIHADISKIRINGTDYPVEVNRDTGAISIEGSSSLSTTLPEVSGVQASLVSLSGLEYVGSPDNSTIYFSTDYNHQNTSPTFEISFIDSMGLTSSSASVVTKGVLQTHYYVSNDLGGGLKTGSPANPFSNVQDAVNKILEIVDSSAKYTIHIGGNITTDADDKSVSGMVVFDSSQSLNLTLQGVSSGKKGTINPQNAKRGIYVNSSNVNLTLGSNLTITGGSEDYGAGVYVERGTINLTGATITGNVASEAHGGGGIYVEDGGVLNLSGSPTVISNTSPSSDGLSNISSNIAMSQNGKVYITGELTGGTESIHITPPGASYDNFYAIGKNYDVTSVDVSKLKSDIAFYDGESYVGIILGVYQNNVFFSSLVYYVSREGNNTSGVSEATAFHTVQPAIDRIVGTGGDRDFVVKIKGEVSGGSTGQYNSVFISSANEVNVTLQGYSSSEKGIIQGDTTKTVLSISGENVYVTLGDNLTLKGAPSGTHHGGGAYINNGATFTMSGGEISGHTLLTDHNDNIRGGGGVYVRNGTFIMSGGEIKNNSAFNGGAVLVVNGQFNMSGGEIHNNTGSGGGSGGGAVFVYYGTDEESTTNKFTMTGGKIYDNQAAYGGAICVYDKSIVDLSGGDIYSNDAIAGFGGAVFMDDGSIANVSDTVDVYENTTVWSGGAIAVHGDRAVIGADSYVAKPCTLNMDGGTIRNNTANGNGGGVYVFGKAEFEMAGGTIENNIAKGSDGGGAIFTQGYVHSKLGVARANFIMSDGTILQNGVLEDGGEISTKYGGGVFVNNLSDMTMSGNASISGNKVSVNGGGLYVNDGATFTMENGTVLNNNAGKHGGGVYLDGTFDYTGGNTDVASKFTFNGGSISNNTVEIAESIGYGAGVYVYENASFVVPDSSTVRTISNNNGRLGSGIFIGRNNNVSLENITISGNTAALQGGGVYVDDGAALTIKEGTVISGNTASGKEDLAGGGVAIDNSTVTMEGGSITDNFSDLGGGVSIFGESFLNLQGDVTISGNTVSESDTTPSNIYFTDSNRIKITGSLELSGEDAIGLSPTFPIPQDKVLASRSNDSVTLDASKFFIDDGSRTVGVSDDFASLISVEAAAAPTITGVYDAATGITTVTITNNEPGATVHYTTNGGQEQSSTDTEVEFTVNTNSGSYIISAYASIEGKNDSPPVEKEFKQVGPVDLTIKIDESTISVAIIGAINFKSVFSFESDTANVTFSSKFNNSETVYTESQINEIPVGATSLTVTATSPGYKTTVRTVTFSQATVEMPRVIYNGETLSDGAEVVRGGVFTLECATIDAEISYKFSGGLGFEPYEGGPINIPYDATSITVKALKNGMIGSGEDTVSFEVKLSTVYLDGQGGLDTNSGDFGKAVLTFEKARSLLADVEGASIVIINTVPVITDTTWDGQPTGRDNQVIVKRYYSAASFGESLISVIAGTLTLENITIDGMGGVNINGFVGEGEVNASGSLVFVGSGAGLILNSGTILQNNNIVGYGGAIYLQGGTLTIPENSTAEIRYNRAFSNNYASGGGVAVYLGGSFTMNGGTISYNHAKTSGGGVYLISAGTFTMNGGTISHNSVDSSGDAGGGVFSDYGGGLVTNNGGTISDNDPDDVVDK